MRGLIIAAFIIGLLMLLALGCSGTLSPALPQSTGRENPALEIKSNPEKIPSGFENHFLWFYEFIFIDPSNPERVKFESKPVRNASTHWNVLSWLEQAPCTSCFKLVKIVPSGNGTFLADIQVKHPFANPGLTGFDVRGIAMFNASRIFPESGLTFSDRTAGDGAVVNPDGYTTLYNSATEGQGLKGLQGYLKGKLATVIPPDALLNAYKRFITDDPANTRNAFYAGDTITVTYEIDMPDAPNPFIIGYAVDASWVSPTGKPVTDPMTDFPPEANCPEPWKINYSIDPVGEGLTDQGGSAVLTLDIFDWQGKTTLLPPRVECPVLIDGFETATWVQDGIGYTRYEVTIQNEDLALVGTYMCLVIAEDTANAGSPDWLDLTAYRIVPVEVVHSDNELPIPLATIFPDPQTVCEPIEFSDNGSYDPDGGSIVLYEWDWDNDGIFDEAGASVSHAWDTVGEKTASFRVTDDEGSLGTLPLFFDVKNAPPVALASSDKTAAFIGETIEFDGSASVDMDCGGESITEYGWDWDEDYIIDAYGVVQSHSFSSGGDHYVNLRVRDDESETVWTDPPVIIDINNGWARTWGDEDYDEVASVACDSIGNIYAFGNFYGTVDFDPGSGINEITSNGSQDIFLSKFNPDGNLLSVFTWGSTQFDGAINVAISSSDDIFLTGYFFDTMDLDPDPVGTVNRTSNGLTDIFIIRLNSSGDYLWGGTMGGLEGDNGTCIAFDESTDCYYLIGAFSGTADFDPSYSMEDYHNSNGDWDCFLSKFKLSTNTYYWTQTWGGIDEEWAWGVDVDSSSIVYICGSFKDTVDFNPGGGVEQRTSNGQEDVFLSSFLSSGNLNWVKAWGDENADRAYSLCASPVASEVWVVGEFMGTVDFNPGAPVDNRDSNGSYDVFLCRYGGDGTYDYALTWGGTGSDTANSISYLADNDRLAITGSFSDTVDFDPGAGSYLRSSKNLKDVFVSDFSGDGTFSWADTWGGDGYDLGQGVAFCDVAPTPIYVGGRFEEVVDFDPQEGEDNQGSNGDYDSFLSRLPPDGVW